MLTFEEYSNNYPYEHVFYYCHLQIRNNTIRHLDCGLLKNQGNEFTMNRRHREDYMLEYEMSENEIWIFDNKQECIDHYKLILDINRSIILTKLIDNKYPDIETYNESILHEIEKLDNELCLLK